MIAKSFFDGRSTFICSVFAVSLVLSPVRSLAADAIDPDAEREGCSKNLEILYNAIQAYRVDHKDLPSWLSDLVPKYLKDPNVLTCPTVRRTGTVETLSIEDPRISTPYTFQFADTPIPSRIPGGAGHTMKEWKQRQMGLVGGKVPMVRCHHHNPVLNLSFDGKIWGSEGAWENGVIEIEAGELFPTRIFASETAALAVARTKAAIPPRDPKTPPNLIDLSRFYNAALSEGWHPAGPGGVPANDLAWMPQGIQKFGDVEFDARGLIQLSSKKLTAARFPSSAKNIKVDQKATRLHFLHSTGWSAADGTPVATYVIHLADGKTHQFTILYGNHVIDWVNERDPKDTKSSMVAWAGKSPANNSQTVLHIYKTEWINPTPEQTITSIDFLSANLDPAPFLIAITAETP